MHLARLVWEVPLNRARDPSLGLGRGRGRGRDPSCGQDPWAHWQSLSKSMAALGYSMGAAVSEIEKAVQAAVVVGAAVALLAFAVVEVGYVAQVKELLQQEVVEPP